MSHESTPTASPPWLAAPDVSDAAPAVEVAEIGQRVGGRMLSAAGPLVGFAIVYVIALELTVFVNADLGIAVALASVGGYFVWVIAQIMAMGRRGANRCRELTGVCILDATTLRPVGFGRIFLRELVFGLIGSVTLGIGTLINLVVLAGRGDRRGWHDLAANTVVVRGGTVATRQGIDVPSGPSVQPDHSVLVARAPRASSPTADESSTPPASSGTPSVTGSPSRDEGPTSVRPALGGLVLAGSDGVKIPLLGRVVVGRDPKDPEGLESRLVSLVDPHRSVSKTHAAFIVDDGCFVQDLGSVNGVVRVRDGVPTTAEPFTLLEVRVGDDVVLGDVTFVVEGS